MTERNHIHVKIVGNHFITHQDCSLTSRFTHFPLNGWHRSTCLVTYTEMIMSFLAICLPHLFSVIVGNVAVKSVWQFYSSCHVYKQSKWKCSTISFNTYCQLVCYSLCWASLQKFCGRLTEQMHLLCLIWQLHSSEELCPKSENTMGKVFILEIKHIMVKLYKWKNRFLLSLF